MWATSYFDGRSKHDGREQREKKDAWHESEDLPTEAAVAGEADNHGREADGKRQALGEKIDDLLCTSPHSACGTWHKPCSCVIDTQLLPRAHAAGRGRRAVGEEQQESGIRGEL